MRHDWQFWLLLAAYAIHFIFSTLRLRSVAEDRNHWMGKCVRLAEEIDRLRGGRK